MVYVERLERHNTQLQAENNELRTANKSLQNAKNSANAAVAELQKEKMMLIEELDRLRSQVRTARWAPPSAKTDSVQRLLTAARRQRAPENTGRDVCRERRKTSESWPCEEPG